MLTKMDKIKKERPELIEKLENTMKYIFQNHLTECSDTALLLVVNRKISIRLILLEDGWSCDFNCTKPLPCDKEYTINNKKRLFTDIIQQTINHVIKLYENK
ncbi:MAG: hypothetical protein KFW21_05875 [Spirochaetota bacterium]|nr:hypothetical protein [Spirochaetota bacterium]